MTMQYKNPTFIVGIMHDPFFFGENCSRKLKKGFFLGP